MNPLRPALALCAAAALAALLTACSSTPDHPKPADLQANPSLLEVRSAWSSRVGTIDFPLDVNISGGLVTLASSDGTVAAIDARTGRDAWRASVGATLAAGVGSDGKVAAVVTSANELVALEAGRELWRARLPAQAFTAPFVAGGRVFVLAADRSVTAFDARNGAKLWSQQRPGEPLVLRQSGVMTAVGDTLVVGLSGRLVGMNSLNGTVRWEGPIASPRGINDVERLVDLVGHASRAGDVLCARAFQTAVGCVNTSRGTVLWSRGASGAEGIAGDDRFVFGTESDGKVIAWRRADGERAWTSERLMHRGLSAPLSLGRSVVVGDGQGYVHLLSREDGSALTRVATDGTAVAAAPVVAGDALVVVTRGGGVYAYLPQ